MYQNQHIVTTHKRVIKLLMYTPPAPTTPLRKLWYFNDNNLELLPESDEKYSVELKDTHTKCQKEFILSIFDVTESDEGTYSCHWLCEYENTTKAAIDLKVVQTGKGFLNFCFATFSVLS